MQNGENKYTNTESKRAKESNRAIEREPSQSLLSTWCKWEKNLRFKGFFLSKSYACVVRTHTIQCNVRTNKQTNTHARTHCYRIVIRTMENRKLNADRINEGTHERRAARARGKRINKTKHTAHTIKCEILLLFIARCSVSQLPVDDTASMRKHREMEREPINPNNV